MDPCCAGEHGSQEDSSGVHWHDWHDRTLGSEQMFRQADLMRVRGGPLTLAYGRLASQNYLIDGAFYAPRLAHACARGGGYKLLQAGCVPGLHQVQRDHAGEDNHEGVAAPQRYQRGHGGGCQVRVAQ